MSEVYVGQIMMTGFPYAQKNFALCNGQLLGINQNTALFSLLGVSYGGNGTTNFMLPNLQARTLYGAGSSVDSSWQPPPQPTGVVGGSENVTLIPSNLPVHNHLINGTTTAGAPGRSANNSLLGAAAHAIYGAPTGAVPLARDTLVPAGGGLPHDNMQPYLVINFNIALSGMFPSRG